jgi:hypothetical protein
MKLLVTYRISMFVLDVINWDNAVLHTVAGPYQTVRRDSRNLNRFRAPLHLQ